MIKSAKLSILAICTVLLAACSSDDSSDEPSNAPPVDSSTAPPGESSNIAPDEPTTAPENTPANDPLGTLIWSPCPDNEALDCTTLSVPMNYNDEQAGNIEIALNRLPALQQPASGVLLLNGGGPSTSLDITVVAEEFDLLPDSVRERYDAISFDPRGFGLSTPISCAVNEEQSSNLYLTNAEMINNYVQESTALAQTCLNQVGDYLLQVGSMNVVRDIESIRQALGVEKLSFLALSYGSRLAALYLQFFPERSEHFIIDASDIRDGTSLSEARDIMSLQQENLDAFLAMCTQLDPNCNADDIEQRLISLANEFSADGDEDLLALLLNLLDTAFDDQEFADILIAPLVSFLTTGDDSALLQVVDSFSGDDDDDGDDEQSPEEELSEQVAQFAVLCSDDPSRPTANDVIAFLDEFNGVSDLWAEFNIDVVGRCVGWPASVNPLPEIGTSTAPSSLVVGGTNDTTTPFEWSVDMANAIGGFLLASSHEDHTIVYSGDSECVDNIVTTFLVDGTLPTAGDCL